LQVLRISPTQAMVRTRNKILTPQRKKSPRELLLILDQQAEENRKIAHQSNNRMVNINEDDEEEEEDGDNDDNYDNNNGNDNDEENDKHHERTRDKGRNNSKSMTSLLEEIRRGADEHVPERSRADDPCSDKMARSAHVSNSGSKRQMQQQASDPTSEEDNDDIAPNAANDDDDDADAASSNQTSVDDDIARTERLLRLYFNSLAKTGTIRTVEEEFTLVTAKLNLIFKRQKFIVSDKDLSEQGNIAQVLFREMEIPVKYQGIWWEEMKLHVREKMDERRSNCGTSVKKGLLGK